jgi:two-component system chemotaxis response regulator CheB
MSVRTFELIVIGCSLGGMHALEKILAELPEDFPIPIAVVQHRYKTSAEGLPSYLRRHARLDVVDAEDKQWIRPGRVYMAPADYHLLVERGEFSLSVDGVVSYARPSVDVLFDSAADAYGSAVIGIVLTGMNADGAHGVRQIKRRGGFVIVQDPATAEAPQMPEAAVAAAQVDKVLPIERIGPYLVELCRFCKPTVDRRKSPRP